MSPRAGSASIEQPNHWSYRAPAGLLQAALDAPLDERRRVLDVGSADGPSVAWLRGDGRPEGLDIDPRGPFPGEGVCASSMSLPLADDTFDLLGAFDVVEHCDSESTAMDELCRVVVPDLPFGSSLFVSAVKTASEEVRA